MEGKDRYRVVILTGFSGPIVRDIEKYQSVGWELNGGMSAREGNGSGGKTFYYTQSMKILQK